MYGLVVELEIDEGQAEHAIECLHNVAVPMITQGLGREWHLDAVP